MSDPGPADVHVDAPLQNRSSRARVAVRLTAGSKAQGHAYAGTGGRCRVCGQPKSSHLDPVSAMAKNLALADDLLEKAFNPDEPRDEHGRWSGGGDSGSGAPGVPKAITGTLFAQGLDPAHYHEHAVAITRQLDALHSSDPTWSSNVSAVKTAMANFPMIHTAQLGNVPIIEANGILPAHDFGKGLAFDQISGLDRTVFMRMGQAGGGGHGAVGVMIDPTKLDASKFLVTRLGAMDLKQQEQALLTTPGSHTAMVAEQLKPYREGTIPLSDLPDVQSRMLVNGYLHDHPADAGHHPSVERIINNDYGEMEVKYAGPVPPSAVVAYFAGDQKLPRFGNQSAFEYLSGKVPDSKLVKYHGEGLHELSRAYRQHYANHQVLKTAHDVSGEARDDHGRWTSGGGSDSTPVAQLSSKLKNEGGFTYNPRSHTFPTSGFVVAVPGHSVIVSDSQLSNRAALRKTVDSYVKANLAAIRANPTLHIGGWHDTAHHELTFDLSEVHANRTKAIRLGRQRNEQAIWHLDSSTEISTGGTGGQEDIVKVRFGRAQAPGHLAGAGPGARPGRIRAVVGRLRGPDDGDGRVGELRKSVARITGGFLDFIRKDGPPDEARDERGRWSVGDSGHAASESKYLGGPYKVTAVEPGTGFLLIGNKSKKGKVRPDQFFATKAEAQANVKDLIGGGMGDVGRFLGVGAKERRLAEEKAQKRSVVVKFNPNHDALGRFSEASGGLTGLDARLVDYEAPRRSLSDDKQLMGINSIVPHARHLDYAETPVFEPLNHLQGTDHPTMTESPWVFEQHRNALFDAQPIVQVNLNNVTYTQPNVNRAAVLHVASQPSDPNRPIYVARMHGVDYVMDGHHRAMGEYMKGNHVMAARVVNFDEPRSIRPQGPLGPMPHYIAKSAPTIVVKFNQHHQPGGQSTGGQFASADGGGGGGSTKPSTGTDSPPPALEGQGGMKTFPAHFQSLVQAKAKTLGITPALLAANMEKWYAQGTSADEHWYQSAHDWAQGLATKYNLNVQQVAAITSSISPLREWGKNQADVETILSTLHDNKPFEVSQTMADVFNAHRAASGKTQLVKLTPGTYYPKDMDATALVATHPDMPVNGTGLRNVIQAVAIARGASVDTAMSGPKTRSFVNNITDPTDARWTTIDTWMYRASLGNHRMPLDHPTKGEGKWTMAEYMKPWTDDKTGAVKQRNMSFLSNPASKADGVKPGIGMYPMFVDAVMAGAKAHGISPNAYQARVWSALVRHG